MASGTDLLAVKRDSFVLQKVKLDSVFPFAIVFHWVCTFVCGESIGLSPLHNGIRPSSLAVDLSRGLLLPEWQSHRTPPCRSIRR